MATTFKLPAGSYYVGDLCYVFNDDNYNQLLKITDYFQNMNQPVQFNGFPVWAGGTYYGDGNYNDNHGNSYLVDAGIIGIASIEVIDESEFHCGILLVFEQEFEVSYDDGIFQFGDYVLDTKNEDDEYDYYDEYLEEDEE